MGRNRLLRIIEPLVLAGGAGYLLDWLSFPVAWLIGPLVAGVGYATLLGTSAPLPAEWMTVAKAMVGIVAASRFLPDDLIRVLVYLLPVVMAISITGGLCMLNGLLISRGAGLDLTTSLLGSIPGTATAVVAVSEEFGADPASVAILQYLRMTIVILVVPVAASFFSAGSPLPPPMDHPPGEGRLLSTTVSLLLILLAMAVGIFLGKRYRLPTGSFLGALLAGLILFFLFPGQIAVPHSLSLVALLVIGLSAGLKFNFSVLRTLWKAVLVEIVLVLFLIMSCLLVGYGFHWLTEVDTTTAMLALAPGGMEAMIASSNQLGGDTGLVVIIMFIRQLLIVTGMVGLRRFFVK